MNKMDRHAISTMFDGRSQVCDVTKILVTSLKSVRKRRQQFHTRDVTGVVAFWFLSSGRKNSKNNRVFRLFLRCKLSLHPFQDPTNMLSCSKFTFNHWLKSSTLVAKNDLRFKVH